MGECDHAITRFPKLLRREKKIRKIIDNFADFLSLREEKRRENLTGKPPAVLPARRVAAIVS